MTYASVVSGCLMPRPISTSRIAFGGIVTALILLLMAAQLVVPTADLFINFLMSLAICIAILEMGRLSAFLIYLIVSAIGFAWPGMPANLTFALVAGLFSFVKIGSEQALMGRRFGKTVTLLLKLMTMVLLGGLYLWVMTEFFVPVSLVDHIFAMPYARYWLVPAIVLIVLVYDYLLSSGIDFYYQRLGPLLKLRHRS